MKFSKYIEMIFFGAVVSLANHSDAKVLRIEILTNNIVVSVVECTDGSSFIITHHSILVLGSEHTTLIGSTLSPDISQIVFTFEDGFKEVKLSEDTQARFLKWFQKGWRTCINFSVNQDRLVSGTRKTYKASNMECPSEPSSIEFASYVSIGIMDFTGTSFKLRSSPTTIDDLKPGDLAVLRSKDTGLIIYCIMYIGNEFFITYGLDKVFFQRIDQVKNSWPDLANSNLELVNIDETQQLWVPHSEKNESAYYLNTNGYMRPIDMISAPSGMYIK